MLTEMVLHFKLIYSEREGERERERERERASRQGAEREGERIPSRFCAFRAEPDKGLSLTNREIMT